MKPPFKNIPIPDTHPAGKPLKQADANAPHKRLVSCQALASVRASTQLAMEKNKKAQSEAGSPMPNDVHIVGSPYFMGD